MIWHKRLMGAFLAGLWVILIFSNVRADTDSMTVFCGSANKPAMEEIASLFERKENIKVHMIFGGSGTLLSQIQLSKKGEIYLPGSPDYIIIAERKKLIIEDSDRIVAYLVPGIITPMGNPADIHDLEDLAKPGMRVGIGNPETVCLGLYGIELLEKNDLLEGVLKNVVTFGASCSKTANLASLNQVDAILGWRVFHFWNPARLEYIPIAPQKMPRISYIPISIPVYTRDIQVSKKFIRFVLSPLGREIYNKYGYITSVTDAKQYCSGCTIGGEYQLPAEYYELIGEVWRK
jgi:molybdate transport system substrate-binding protein